MKVLVNGQTHQFETSMTISGVLDVLGYKRGTVSVALNQTFVTRNDHDVTFVKDGDELDIVAPRQGG